jgi:uncharacterized repeat protein (TIGR01451 family)
MDFRSADSDLRRSVVVTNERGDSVRKAISLAVLGSIAMLAMALAGASSAARPHAGLVGAPTAASSKVRAIGPGFVRQVGLRNYAGPNCPGSGWNCTSSTRVLQASNPGGQNVAECTDSVVTNPCTILQNGASNTARCTQKSTTVSSVTQSCTITQTGATNIAFVTQTISQSDGSDQYGSQAAAVTQTGSALNQLQLIQDASQNIKTGSTQIQNMYQSAVVIQNASSAGNNVSSLYQSQLQKENAKSTAQSQNDGTGTGLGDCFGGTPTKPNACANVSQTSVNGTNDNHLKQFISEDQNSSGPATQIQGSSTGGLDGRIHQETTGSGHSNNDVNQNKALKQTVPKGPGSTQDQTDPVRCCGTFSQVGGTGNTETISQSSSLTASDPGADQSSTLIGESNSPTGSCSITQRGSVNNDSNTETNSFSPCPPVTIITSCESGTEGGCSSFERAPDSSLVLSVRNVTKEGSFGSTATAETGDTLEYQIVYDNTGNGAAHNVTLNVPIPAGTTYFSSFCPQNSSVITSFTCLLGPASSPGTVVPGESAIFRTATMRVVVNATSGSITNTASVSTLEEGSTSSGSTSVSVVNQSRSTLQKLVRPVCFEGPCPGYSNAITVNNGGQVEYQIAYSNAGPGDAGSVTVTDVLDAHTIDTNLTCSGGISCSYDSQARTITWNLGTVPPTGANPVLLGFIANVGAQCGGTTGHAFNTASVTTTEQSGVQSGSTDVSILTGPC